MDAVKALLALLFIIAVVGSSMFAYSFGVILLQILVWLYEAVTYPLRVINRCRKPKVSRSEMLARMHKR